MITITINLHKKNLNIIFSTSCYSSDYIKGEGEEPMKENIVSRFQSIRTII